MIAEPDAVALLDRLAALRTGRLTVSAVWSARGVAERHGVLAVFAEAALATDAAADAAAREALAAQLRQAVARDLFQQTAARRVVAALAAAGIETVVLKGEHVARAFYAKSYVRPRADTDLLIHPHARVTAREVLEGLEYVRTPHVGGDAILAEMPFTREWADGAVHYVDVHWHPVTPHPFRSILPFDEAWARSTPINSLGAHARGLCAADALLLSVVHLAVHHPGDVRLMWIGDIDLIARTLDEEAWRTFEAAAAAAGVCTLARAALLAAARFFLTPVSDRSLDFLKDHEQDERLAGGYLVPRSKAERLVSELRSLHHWRERAEMIYQHLVPDADYMRRRYDVDGLGLAWSYVRRAAGGARAWLARPSSVAISDFRRQEPADPERPARRAG